ncbi:MAG: hypothetical protein QOI47_1939, partial [Actinomycetota bacterium]|nr:hypothetical protein [Actinomycetota bacterium]
MLVPIALAAAATAIWVFAPT